MRPFARSGGSGGNALGASSRSLRGSRSQARWNGEKTVYGVPFWVRSPPTSSTTLTPGCAWSSARSSALTRRPRRRANGLTSALRWSSSAPISAASFASSRSGGPWRITRPPPRARSELSRSRRQSSRNCVRGPERWRPCSSRSSRQKTGTTDSWRSSALRSAGWSCTRRSRRYQTIAVISVVTAPTVIPAQSPPVHRVVELTGKTALITGGNRGIGRAVAEALAREPLAKLLVGARSPERAEPARGAGGRRRRGAHGAHGPLLAARRSKAAVRSCPSFERSISW